MENLEALVRKIESEEGLDGTIRSLVIELITKNQSKGLLTDLRNFCSKHEGGSEIYDCVLSAIEGVVYEPLVEVPDDSMGLRIVSFGVGVGVKFKPVYKENLVGTVLSIDPAVMGLEFEGAEYAPPFSQFVFSPKLYPPRSVQMITPGMAFSGIQEAGRLLVEKEEVTYDFNVPVSIEVEDFVEVDSGEVVLPLVALGVCFLSNFSGDYEKILFPLEEEAEYITRSLATSVSGGLDRQLRPLVPRCQTFVSRALRPMSTVGSEASAMKSASSLDAAMGNFMAEYRYSKSKLSVVLDTEFSEDDSVRCTVRLRKAGKKTPVFTHDLFADVTIDDPIMFLEGIKSVVSSYGFSVKVGQLKRS